MNLGLTSDLIVEPESAMLGYAEERSQHLNTDHRNLVRFKSQHDSNYRTIRLTSLVGAKRNLYQVAGIERTTALPAASQSSHRGVYYGQSCYRSPPWKPLLPSLEVQRCFYNKSECFLAVDGIPDGKNQFEYEAMEATNPDTFRFLFQKVDNNIPLNIFITNQPSAEVDQIFSSLQVGVLTDYISASELVSDISRFMASHSSSMSVDSADSATFIDVIVEKSAGNFLWAVLVMK
ncbi:hypothetical protein B0O99DRAFT_588290 [Bisporella sp. PMI_857]|nr:hypothetical protein B0O99DRAFT_588290 [Bisporella sp. PMI_857]